ncbi:MAG: MC/SLC25 family protein [archaeon]|nr:MC/SLC25 family protein [archaeon]
MSWKDVNLLRYFMWSSVCSLTVDGMLHPLDLLKTRLQVQGNTLARPMYPNYGGFVDAIRSIGTREGLRGFWKGFSSAGPSGLLSQYSYYATYEVAKQKLTKLSVRWNFLKDAKDVEAPAVPIVHLLSGAAAEFMSALTETPLNIVTRRLMVQGPAEYAENHPYRGPVHAFRAILQQDGLRGLYRGFGATLLTGIPASATAFASYEWVRRHLHQFRRYHRMDGSIEKHSVHIISGATAGLIGAVVVQPLDLALTRLQVQVHSQDGVAPKYRNAFHVISTVSREEGLRALAKGLVPRILHFVPMGALGFSTYELVKYLAKKDPKSSFSS